MKKEVRVTLEGIQDGDIKETLASRSDGIYQYQNGKHYIRYEEAAEDGVGKVKNTLKLSAQQIVMRKEGPGINTQLIFDPAEETHAVYQTPYGSLNFQITGSVILMTEEEDEIRVILRYNLSDQGIKVSENQVKIHVRSI